MVYYDDEYKVLICREHRYAIRNLDTHLRDKHGIAIKRRRIIVDSCASLALARPTEVRQPPPLGPAFDALGPPVDALLCSEAGCGFTSVQPTWIRHHCNTAHGWRSTAGSRKH